MSTNVRSGIEVQSAHRQGPLELFLGTQGVAFNNSLQGNVRRIEEHKAALRVLADAIAANARGPYKVDKFCALLVDDDTRL